MAVGVPAGASSKGNDFEITYQGKRSITDILSSVRPKSYRVLHSPDRPTINTLYYGDNLAILEDLATNADLVGKTQLIYIDPPYATNSRFSNRNLEFAYEDMLTGSTFLEFLRQRLILMRELLTNDGAIYLHLDSKMVFETKLIMDEIFGPKNFRSFITRKKSNPKNYSKKQYGNISDFLLFYSKSQTMKFNVQRTPWSEDAGKKEYQYIEEGSGRRYKKVPIHAPGVRNGATGREWRGMLPPPGKHWQYTPERLDAMDAKGEIYWSPTGNPRRKIYLDTAPGIAMQDIWLDFKDAHNQNIKITGYPTEKNLDLLKTIIQASSDEGDLVIDAFAGSGTTLEAADILGRSWVGIDNSPLAISTIEKRFEAGSEKMGDFRPRRNNDQPELELVNKRTKNFWIKELII